MTKRIAASEATRERLQAVMDGNLDTTDGRGELLRLAARAARQVGEIARVLC